MSPDRERVVVRQPVLDDLTPPEHDEPAVREELAGNVPEQSDEEERDDREEHRLVERPPEPTAERQPNGARTSASQPQRGSNSVHGRIRVIDHPFTSKSTLVVKP